MNTEIIFKGKVKIFKNLNFILNVFQNLDVI